jgi:CheY-like chemotaxis protein
VSDWMMPRMDGTQLCRCLRSKLGAPYTYFILLTALGDPEHRLAGMHAGADDYLGKPFNLYDLEARLIAAERVTGMHRRREALLRQARRSAAEANPTRLLDDLLREAIALVGGSAGIVTRWDEDIQALVAVGASTPALEAQQLRLGEGASGRAAELRTTVLLGRLEHGQADPVLVDAALEAAIAVPLLHEARLLGTLAVGSVSGDKQFTQEDAELLELLGATAVSALVALEHARLDGVLLAARTAQHELNNQLAVARGYAELLVASADLPPNLVQIAEEVKCAADHAADIVRQLGSISHIHEHHWPEPADTTIDLAMSQY